MKRIFLTEEEKDNLSKKHEEIDRTRYNFLLFSIFADLQGKRASERRKAGMGAP